MMHTDLFAWLSTNLTVKALFPGGVYHMSLPQTVQTFPAMSFARISLVEREPDMEAPNDPKLDEVGYQFDMIGEESQSLIEAAETFHSIFRNLRGTIGATKIQNVDPGNMIQLEERRGDKLRRRVVTDYAITFES